MENSLRAITNTLYYSSTWSLVKCPTDLLNRHLCFFQLPRYYTNTFTVTITLLLIYYYHMSFAMSVLEYTREWFLVCSCIISEVSESH